MNILQKNMTIKQTLHKLTYQTVIIEEQYLRHENTLRVFSRM
jgi:hypothetical protein